MNQTCKIMFSDSEGGWAEALGDGTYKLLNSPLEPGLCWGDIVTAFERSDGRMQVKDVVRKHFALQTGVKYTGGKGTFGRLVDAARKLEWQLEGMVSGAAVLNHPEGTDPAKLAELSGVGVTFEPYESMPPGADDPTVDAFPALPDDPPTEVPEGRVVSSLTIDPHEYRMLVDALTVVMELTPEKAPTYAKLREKIINTLSDPFENFLTTRPGVR
jgi:hypothetical protein